MTSAYPHSSVYCPHMQVCCRCSERAKELEVENVQVAAGGSDCAGAGLLCDCTRKLGRKWHKLHTLQ